MRKIISNNSLRKKSKDKERKIKKDIFEKRNTIANMDSFKTT